MTKLFLVRLPDHPVHGVRWRTAGATSNVEEVLLCLHSTDTDITWEPREIKMGEEEWNWQPLFPEEDDDQEPPRVS
jgi:hypothetical protein